MRGTQSRSGRSQQPETRIRSHRKEPVWPGSLVMTLFQRSSRLRPDPHVMMAPTEALQSLRPGEPPTHFFYKGQSTHIWSEQKENPTVSQHVSCRVCEAGACGESSHRPGQLSCAPSEWCCALFGAAVAHLRDASVCERCLLNCEVVSFRA